MRLHWRRSLQERLITRKSGGASMLDGSRKDFSRCTSGKSPDIFCSRPRGLIAKIWGWKLRESGDQIATELLTDEPTLDESWPCGTSVSLTVKLGTKARLYQNQMFSGLFFNYFFFFFDMAVKSWFFSYIEGQKHSMGYFPGKIWTSEVQE